MVHLPTIGPGVQSRMVESALNDRQLVDRRMLPCPMVRAGLSPIHPRNFFAFLHSVSLKAQNRPILVIILLINIIHLVIRPYRPDDSFSKDRNIPLHLALLQIILFPFMVLFDGHFIGNFGLEIIYTTSFAIGCVG